MIALAAQSARMLHSQDQTLPRAFGQRDEQQQRDADLWRAAAAPSSKGCFPPPEALVVYLVDRALASALERLVVQLVAPCCRTRGSESRAVRPTPWEPRVPGLAASAASD